MIALLELRRRHDLGPATVGAADGLPWPPADQAPSLGVALGVAQRLGLRLATALRHGLGEVGEDDREPQPRRDQPREGRRVADGKDGRPRRADLDDEHDRVAPQRGRVQFADRVR